VPAPAQPAGRRFTSQPAPTVSSIAERRSVHDRQVQQHFADVTRHTYPPTPKQLPAPAQPPRNNLAPRTAQARAPTARAAIAPLRDPRTVQRASAAPSLGAGAPPPPPPAAAPPPLPRMPVRPTVSQAQLRTQPAPVPAARTAPAQRAQPAQQPAAAAPRRTAPRTSAASAPQQPAPQHPGFDAAVDTSFFPKQVWDQPERPPYVHVVDTPAEARRVMTELHALAAADAAAAGTLPVLGRDCHARRVFACDTEVTGIDVKRQCAAGHGRVTCWSAYGGPDLDFAAPGLRRADGRVPACVLWVDTFGQGGASTADAVAIWDALRPFLESDAFPKVRAGRAGAARAQVSSHMVLTARPPGVAQLRVRPPRAGASGAGHRRGEHCGGRHFAPAAPCAGRLCGRHAAHGAPERRGAQGREDVLAGEPVRRC